MHGYKVCDVITLLHEYLVGVNSEKVIHLKSKGHKTNIKIAQQTRWKQDAKSRKRERNDILSQNT